MQTAHQQINGYAIMRSRWTLDQGIVLEILAHDGRWYSQADDVFSSLAQAKAHFKTLNLHEVSLIRPKYFIQGPNGGIHPLKVKV